MMNRRRIALAALAALPLAAASGCACDKESANLEFTPRPVVHKPSLVAGDGLGRTLFYDRVAIGPIRTDSRPTYAEVPTR